MGECVIKLNSLSHTLDIEVHVTHTRTVIITYILESQSSLIWITHNLQYIPRNMHTVLALLCFVVVIHWLIFPYPSGLLHWHCGNLTIAPVPAKQPWWIWINTSCEFIMNDCITTTKQSTTKLCAYFLGYTVHVTINLQKMTKKANTKRGDYIHSVDDYTLMSHTEPSTA